MSSLGYASGTLNVENYYHDPGEVNVRLFYPVLDYSFSKQLVNFDKDLIHSTAEKFGPEHKGDGSIEKVAQSRVPDEKQNEDDENVEKEKEKTGKIRELEEKGDNCIAQPVRSGMDFDNHHIQAGVFSTAVSEESIDAAKQRSKELFHTDGWRSDRQPGKGLAMRIVIKKANEYFHLAMKEKNAVRVITYLNKAINIKSEDPVLYVERGEAYLCLCDFQSAILNYKKACLLAAQNQDYHARLAFLYYFQGQTLFDQRLFSEALASFSRASKMVPENVGYQTRCLACLAALQKHDQCLEMVNKRLDVDKGNPDLYILRARLHEISANTSLCYQDVTEALVLNPDHPGAQSMMDAFVKRATSYKLQAMQLSIVGKDKEAMQKMSLAIQTHPSVADYYVLRGALHRKLKDFNSAVDDFLLALDKSGHKEEDPVFKNSQRQLLLTFNDFAVECFNKGYFQEAIMLLTKALKEEKNEKSLYINRGDCYFKQDELNFALQDYQQAQELDPQDQTIKLRISLVCNEFGLCLFEDRNFTDAEAEFTLALQYCPQVGQYYISRSRARYMLKDLTGAREDLLQGLLLSPTNAEVMTITSRLFPGKSIADIIGSPAAKHAQMKLNSLVAANAADKRPPTGLGGCTDTEGCRSSEESGTGEAQECEDGQTLLQSEEARQSTESRTSYSLCMEDREFYVQEKRRTGNRVKDVLLNRQSLRYNGPYILPLPSPASQILGSALQDHKQSPAAATGKTKSGADKSTWRNFSLRIGGIKNLT